MLLATTGLPARRPGGRARARSHLGRRAGRQDAAAAGARSQGPGTGAPRLRTGVEASGPAFRQEVI